MDTNLYLLQTAAMAAQAAQDGQARNTIIIGVLGVVTTLITIGGSVWLARIAANAKVSADTAKATDEKTQVLLEKTEQIHTLTNSNLSKVSNALEVMTTKNTESEKMISSLNQRITDYERKVLVPDPIKYEMKTAVKEAIAESVKAPVKEAVAEASFTPAQISQIIEGFRHLQK